MQLSEYQCEAQRTDQKPGDTTESFLIPLLGIAGEVGTLLVEYKKHLRDGESHQLFKEHIAEELGDTLWYLANLATKFELDLNDLAIKNLEKTRARWLPTISESYELFDEPFPAEEQIPRIFELNIVEKDLSGTPKITLYMDGEQVGDPLTDNSYDDDGYRFHDVFHFGLAAYLGWSPVVRHLIKHKRKSIPMIDEVEDGGRAQVFEEAIAALAFEYASSHDYLDGVEAIDYSLLRTIMDIVGHTEVRVRTASQWQDAILQIYAVWREVRQNSGGVVRGDLMKRSLVFVRGIS